MHVWHEEHIMPNQSCFQFEQSLLPVKDGIIANKVCLIAIDQWRYKHFCVAAPMPYFSVKVGPKLELSLSFCFSFSRLLIRSTEKMGARPETENFFSFMGKYSIDGWLGLVTPPHTKLLSFTQPSLHPLNQLILTDFHPPIVLSLTRVTF